MNYQIQSAEVLELSLEKVIETKLVQSNVTRQVLDALKEKYGGLKLKSLNDKEGYLEIKAASKECAKVRTLTKKLCKEGREKALQEQKLWIAKEKEIVNEITEVESTLDAEIAMFDAEVARKANEEKKRQEDAFIYRQAALTKLGAVYQDGCFVLGDALFEANLIKGASEDIWARDVLPKYQSIFEKIEADRLAEEKMRKESEEAFELEKQRLEQERVELRQQQEEIQRQKEDELRKSEEEKKAMIKARCVQLESLGMKFSFQYDAYVFEDVNIDSKTEISLLNNEEWDALIKKITPIIEESKARIAEEAERKRQAEIEEAAQKRMAEEKRLEELKEQQRLAELEAAGDKVKWDAFIVAISGIEFFDMRSGQYRKKMGMAKEKIQQILAL